MGCGGSKYENGVPVRYGMYGEPHPIKPKYYNGRPKADSWHDRYYDNRSTSQRWADEMTAKTGRKWKKGQLEAAIAGGASGGGGGGGGGC
ncbi:hypothetical protein CKM354_000509300 [Cercospora kikuchii]|uniref:Uncharacterized protein n=1 Tax=Cercospora kikuchii TaxID=84275 RepID=A0A9P3CCN0_9PEZI|nr:uncharacterized protein CKM354_000509300 [Cercospora kikuchii]GIZ41799.1 hypothetical protein CKM354_000509300 [Cercospora kikuchii]